VLGLIVLSLSACDKAEQTAKVNSLLPESQEFPTEALTWDEWVAYSGPERGEEFEYSASGEGFQYYGKGFPNISNWKPEDFLPAELFEQKHRDICELPKFTRSTLRSQNGSILLYSDIYELIALAEQGYSNAQSAMWMFCYIDSPQFIETDSDEHAVRLPHHEKPLSQREAWQWVQRGAASGNALDQYRLSQCMDAITWAPHSEEGKKSLNSPVKVDPFWEDKIFFWRERSFETALLIDSVNSRTGSGNPFLVEHGSDRGKIEKFKWSRLWELTAGFQREGRRPQDIDTYGTGKLVKKMSAPQLAQAEKEIKQWLHAHPDIWMSMYRNTYVRYLDLCPGEPGYDEGFDFDWLNKKLAPYGLTVDKPPA